MSLFRSMGLSAAGMAVERFRMDTTAGNLANAGTVARPGEKPFVRQLVDVTGGADGPKVLGNRDDPGALPNRDYRPEDPNAGADGFVETASVNPVTEMLDMMGATRAYEANVKAFNAAKGMARSALEIGKA